MHAPLMRKFGIAAKQIPALNLSNQSGDSVKLEPRGLRILDNNGRIELKYNGVHYFIVDFAENFKQPDWRVTKEWLTHVLQ